MSFNESHVGRITDTPVPAIATRCADYIADFTGPRAVSIDREGRVWIERPEDANHAELVGVYRYDLGRITLARQLTEDLLHEKQARGFVSHLSSKPGRRRQS